MEYDPALRLAVRRPDYESDFSAISDMLGASQPVCIGDYILFRWGDAYLLTGSEGPCHSHLIKEYAIHHLLHCHYAGTE